MIKNHKTKLAIGISFLICGPAWLVRGQPDGGPGFSKVVPESVQTAAETTDTPAALSPNGEDALTDPLSMTSAIPQGALTPTLPWHPPDFSHQENALGYKPDVFAVPAGLRSRVQFWKDIYSKYTTNQGVMHDSVYVDIVYEPIDFGPIMSDSSKNIFQKNRAREHLIKERRSEIEQRLKRIQAFKTADGLAGEDLRYWKMFEGVHDEKRYSEAAEHGRVRFQLGQKDRFILGIYYAGRYIHRMEKIFRDENLPVELTRLPFVESSFNILARSRVGASGVWQFMRRTAKPFMSVNSSIDERNDPLHATRASARLLKQNYAMLQSWPLAVTGYNHGPYGVRGITNRLGTRDIAEIVNTYSSRSFGFASENFYSCFLAALDVERNAGKYFPGVRWGAEIESIEISLNKSFPYSALLAIFDGNSDATTLLNPHLLPAVRKGRQNIPRGTFVRVPPSRTELATDLAEGKISLSKFLAQAQSLSATRPINTITLAAAAAASPQMMAAPSLAELEKSKGPQLIAAPAAPTPPPSVAVSTPAPTPTPAPVSVAAVAPISDARTLSILNVASASTPALSTAVPGAAAKSTFATQAVADTKPDIYKIRHGDSWFRIAKKTGVGVAELREANPKFKSDNLPYGKTLNLPKAEIKAVDKNLAATSAASPSPAIVPAGTPAATATPKKEN
jgi:membrane-bound lytic murein transglycosylase D